jgi:hypothetical protein
MLLTQWQLSSSPYLLYYTLCFSYISCREMEASDMPSLETRHLMGWQNICIWTLKASVMTYCLTQFKRARNFYMWWWVYRDQIVAWTMQDWNLRLIIRQQWEAMVVSDDQVLTMVPHHSLSQNQCLAWLWWLLWTLFSNFLQCIQWNTLGTIVFMFRFCYAFS